MKFAKVLIKMRRDDFDLETTFKKVLIFAIAGHQNVNMKRVLVLLTKHDKWLVFYEHYLHFQCMIDMYFSKLIVVS